MRLLLQSLAHRIRSAGSKVLRTRTFDVRTKTVSIELSHINQLRLPDLKGRARIRIDVVTPEYVLHTLLVTRPGFDQLIVLNNGAVDRGRSNGTPVFQRSSWSHKIPAHQLYICDPLTTEQGSLSLAWGQVASDLTIYPAVTQVVKILSRRLGISARDRTYFGSSGGGFMALVEHSLDPGSRAVVNNAQFDWTRWHTVGVKPLLHQVFNGLTPDQVREAYPFRTNALVHLDRSATAPRVTYLVNLASMHDRSVELPQYLDYLRRQTGEGSQIALHAYFDPRSGHGPLSVERTLAHLMRPKGLQ